MRLKRTPPFGCTEVGILSFVQPKTCAKKILCNTQDLWTFVLHICATKTFGPCTKVAFFTSKADFRSKLKKAHMRIPDTLKEPNGSSKWDPKKNFCEAKIFLKNLMNFFFCPKKLLCNQNFCAAQKLLVAQKFFNFCAGPTSVQHKTSTSVQGKLLCNPKGWLKTSVQHKRKLCVAQKFLCNERKITFHHLGISLFLTEVQSWVRLCRKMYYSKIRPKKLCNFARNSSWWYPTSRFCRHESVPLVKISPFFFESMIFPPRGTSFDLGSASPEDVLQKNPT